MVTVGEHIAMKDSKGEQIATAIVVSVQGERAVLKINGTFHWMDLKTGRILGRVTSR